MKTSIAAAASLAILAAIATSHPRAQTAPLPKAEDVIAKHIAAIGGAAAWKQVSSLSMQGTFEIPSQNLSGNLEIKSARPGSVLLRVALDGLGTIETGFNGTHGWSLNPVSGPALMTGRELQDTKDDAWFDSTLYEAGHIKSMTVVGRETFEGRDAYKLQLVLASGREQTEYFDVQDGWQIGSESRRETPMGVVPSVSVLRDYKAFGQIKQPTIIVQRALGLEQVLRLNVVVLNTVPATAFEPPAEIKALIKTAGGGR